MITFITGGARSGKSALAENLATKSGLEVVYVATACAGDDEMIERIRQHRQRRPDHWATVEEPLELAEVLRLQAAAGRFVIVDCLTLWLGNLLFADFPAGHGSDEEVRVIEPGALFTAQRAAFLRALAGLPGELAVISNELGMGVIPLGALSRLFVDEAGRLNQEVAARANRVILMVSGCPLVVKGEALPC